MRDGAVDVKVRNPVWSFKTHSNKHIDTNMTTYDDLMESAL